jgi:hypothetical protein
MQTYEQALTDAAWVEILGGETSLYLDILTSKDCLLNFGESDTAPALDAPAVRVQSWPHGFDFAISGVPLGQKIWARALGTTVVELVVVR